MLIKTIAVQNVFQQRKLYGEYAGALGLFDSERTTRLRIIAVKKIVSNGVACPASIIQKQRV